ncbi:hypothetical protein QLS71_002715 [Mariniflexile litorale]|uniref:Uncharacterized protein n=1 Tax=Mariniflexile litorale TaxID=3045158 RepID=A0AAU7EHL0_9FLAO|nr:hypothetical protein [Mariniflexile sp. KMM 9835]MDQ8209931.1 hypothetical protein [Mariniflexile sp. KMM 9835]
MSNLANDVCVLCGSETLYPTNTPINERVNYIKGAGQLCYSCSSDVYGYFED